MLERRHRKQERRLGNEKWKITPGLNEKGVTRPGTERKEAWGTGAKRKCFEKSRAEGVPSQCKGF